MKFIPQWRLRKPAQDASTVYISETFGVRALHIGSDTVQSAMRIAKPHDLELSYTRSMMAFLLFLDDPRAVLMIGLGGGSVAKYIYRHLPRASVRVIEIDSQVLAIAHQCFLLPSGDDRLQVVIGDGAQYMGDTKVRVQLMMVDGYDAESQAAALTTTEFYRACLQGLTNGGVLVVNLWSGDRQFAAVLKRIGEIFKAGILCLPAHKPGNIIVFAFRDKPLDLSWVYLEAKAADLEQHYSLEFSAFVSALRTMNRHDAEGLLI